MRLLLLLPIAILAAGCAKNIQPAPPGLTAKSLTPSPKTPPGAATVKVEGPHGEASPEAADPHTGVPGAPPLAGGGRDAAANGGGGMPSVQEPPEIAALARKVAEEKAHMASHGAPDDKIRTAEALYQYGHALIHAAELLPMYKYRRGLVQLREALKLNPDHAKAKEDIELVESIYRSMGRPVPSG
jgi:hypothetical protein